MIRVNKITGRLKKAVEYVLPVLKNLNVTPSKSKQVFEPVDSDGYDIVTVEAVTSDIDTNIKAENIKENVSILGVKGTYVGAKYKPRTLLFKDYKGTDLTYETKNIDTSLLTSMANMFDGCSSLTSLDVSNFVTTNVTNMGGMFSNCSNLTSLNVSNFDTTKVTNMRTMFYYCNRLKTINVSNLNTSNVTDMGAMFYTCNALETLDLSSFNTDNLTDIGSMFYNCTKLTSLDIRNFNFNNVIFVFS